MKLSNFRLEIPENLIAEYPVEPRDLSKLMVVHRETGEIEHRQFKDIVDYFEDGDVMVLNDTKVFPAKLKGTKEKTGAEIEVFLLRELNPRVKLWDVLVDPARKIRVGNKLYFGDNDLVAEVVDNTTSRGRTIRFLFEEEEETFYRMLESLGETPLPPYIARAVEEKDAKRYQTVFAKEKGAVSVPDGSIHFTRELLKRLELYGVEQSYITLHSGIGAYNFVEVEDLSKHKMESEYFKIPQNTVDMVNNALENKKKICAVGSTVLKTLESSVSANRLLKKANGWTDRFIFPPYKFNIPNAFITDFHLPKSTLMMMTAAFLGYDLMIKAYETAMKEGYRFYSYGDALLIL